MYKVERTKFINWICTSCYFDKHQVAIKQALIMGSEYIVTAEDLLANVDNIPAYLVDGYAGTRYVKGSDCELYYKPSDELLP